MFYRNGVVLAFYSLSDINKIKVKYLNRKERHTEPWACISNVAAFSHLKQKYPNLTEFYWMLQLFLVTVRMVTMLLAYIGRE